MGNQSQKSKNENINRILKRNVSKSQLTREDLDLINDLGKTELRYYYCYCPTIPLINITIDSSGDKSNNEFNFIVNFKEDILNDNKEYDSHSHNFSGKEFFKYLKFYNQEFIIKRINKTLLKKRNKKEQNLLPFENIEDFYKFKKVLIKFLNLKSRITFYNGDYHKNIYYNFFEHILRLSLYGLGTLYEYNNSLNISDFLDFDFLKHFNIGQNMENGHILYELDNIRVPKTFHIRNIIKLNDNGFFAFIASDTGIFLETINYDNNNSSTKLNFNRKALNDKFIPINFNKNYSDIIELSKDNYLLHFECCFNLVIASYNKKELKFDFKDDIKFETNIFKKLKNGNILFINKSNISLCEYNRNYFIEKKIININFSHNSFHNTIFICLELLNNDIIFSNRKQIYYINRKTFNIQTIYKHDKYCISRLFQFKNKDYFYYSFFIKKMLLDYEFYERVNVKNGKIKTFKEKAPDEMLVLDIYIIKYCGQLEIYDEKNKIFTKQLKGGIKKLFLLNEKKRIFIFFDSNNEIHVFKIN